MVKGLDNHPYFAGLNQEELEKFNSITHQKRYKANEIIFFEDEPGENFFIIDSGRVKMVKMLPNGDEQILNIFKAGDIFAEVIIFDDKPYPATAIAMKDSTLYIIDKNKLENILISYPEITLKIMKEMSRRLRRAQQNVRDLGLKNSTNRMASILLHLAKNHGVKKSGNIEISLSLTQGELANMIGTSRETVSRILSKFEKAGVLTTSRKLITIKDRKKLKTYI